MNPKDRRLWLDWQTSLYLEALENEDFDAQAKLWEIAAKEPELEAAFHETHEAILEERQAEVTRAVTDAAEKHLTSGEILQYKTGPVTVADVAAELFRHPPKGFGLISQAIAEKLRTSTEPIPADLGISALAAWALPLFGSMEREQLLAFKDAAMKLRMRRTSEVEYGLAARQTKKPEDQQ